MTAMISLTLTVEKGATLWSIARELVSTNENLSMKNIPEIVNEIHQQNPEAFVEGDINKLKEGAELSLPSDVPVEDLAQPLSEQTMISEETAQTADKVESAEVEDKLETEVEEVLENQAPAATNESEISPDQPTDMPQVQEGVQSDMVADTVAAEDELDNKESSIEETEKGFFTRNWLWIGAIAGGGVALAASSSDDPIPVPTVSLSGNEAGGPEASLTVSGTADNNATVAVTIGSVTKNASSTAEGAYSITFDATDIAAAGQGTLSVSVTSNINNGRVSETTTASVFTDTLAPSAPTIADITSDNVINASEQTTIITGTAESGSTITLSIADDVKTITVAADGTWSYALTTADITAAGQGEEIISLTATDSYGNVSDATTLTINVDTLAPTAPTIADVATDNVVNGAEQTTAITGTAEANALITLTVAGTTKTVTTDSSGAWTYSLTAADLTAMGEGAETLSATATDAAGNTSAAATKAIAVDTLTPTAPTIADVTTDNVVNGAEQTAVITGTAEANAQITLTVAGTTKNVTADSSGAWTYSLTPADVTAMGEGAETLSATATDAAGNTSSAGTKDLSVDTIAADVQSIAADSANQTITLTYNDVLDATNLPGVTSFAITTANASNAVASVAVNGNEVVLTMTDAFSDGIAVTVNYTDAAGDQANAIQDLVGNDAPSFATGVVADGYIRGAKIYLDVNGNGLADADELLAGVTTDAQGNFVLSANDNPNNYSIIATGGVNVDTGLVNTTPLKAPAGSSVINPLTTLIQTAVESGAANSVAEAKTFINLALGIASDIDLTTFDPISSLNDGDASAATSLVIQKAATQVVALVQLASQGKSQADALADSQNIFKNIVTNAQTAVAANPGQAIDIADEAVITSIMDGVDVTVSIANIAAASQTLQAATSLTEVSVAQAQTLDNVAPDAPSAVELVALTKDTTPAVKVSFDTQDLSGKAAVAGDTISLKATGENATVTTTVLLTSADIVKGFVEINSDALADDTYTVTAQVIDKGDNTSTALTAANTIKIDTTAPNVALVSNQDVVNQTETATITLTFTEDPADSIAIEDLTATGGTLSDFAGTGLTRTVTFTPTADVEQSGSVSVTAGSYLDAISNAGTAGTVEFSIDTSAPNVTITADDTALQSGDTATITFTFSEAPGDSFSTSDITVTGGTLSELSGDGAVQTATFTPTVDTEETASITIAADTYTDAAGNQGAAGATPSVSIDTKAATLTTETLSAAENATAVGSIVTSESATVTLGEGDDSALFTLTDGVLTLNEAQDFETDDTSLTVNFDLTDAAGNTSTDSVTVNVTNVNEAPVGVVDIVAQTAVVAQAFSLDVTDSFSDVDANDTLTYSIVGDLPAGLTFTDGVISGTATAGTAAATVTVTATDAGGLTASEAFTITAVSAPVINAIEVKQDTSDIAKAGEELTITATVSESFALTLNDATPTMVVTLGSTDVTATYASHNADAKTLTFIATAPTGDATSVVVKSVTLGAATLIGVVSSQPLAAASVGQTDVNFTLDNTAATITTDTLSATENTTAVGSIVTSESATVTLGQGDDSALFTLTDGVLTMNEAQDFETDDTSLTVNFDLTDAAGNTSTDSVTVNVTNVNEAPVGVDIAAQTAVVAQAFSLDVTDSFSDVDANDTLTYSIVGDLPAGLTFTDGVISGTASADTTTATVTVTATDAAGLTASEAFTISAVSAPIITTELSNLGEKMLDVRSDIILQIDQAVSGVTGKTITFTDNTETGYQGETQTNSFTIAADSDLVTIDNDKGVIIINVDANFDLDLSSNYTLSIDDGAFVSTLSGLASATVADITFNTVTPTSGADALLGLGGIDQVGSKTNFFNTKWLADWQADTDTGGYSHTYLVKSGFSFIPVTDISNQDVIASIGGDTEYYISFDGSDINVVTLDFLMSVSDIAYEALSSDDSAAYEIQISAAQGYMMNDDDGSLVESAQWVDIEGLGNGLPSGSVNSLAADVEAGNVFELDASTSDYVFVFSDQNPNGGDELVGAGIATNTDLAVFIDEFGADDVIYVDDAFNDADNINILEYEVFANGKGGEGTELYLGLSGGDGDPRLYVGLEGDIESTDENGNADSTLDGVNDALGMDGDDSVVITA